MTLEDAQGGEIWRLRTVIHTAADRLECRCALELPGWQLRPSAGATSPARDSGRSRRRALAVVGREGVLRRIVPVEAKEAGQRVGCVCDMAYDAESGLLLLVSRTEDGAENVGAIQTADGETAWTVGAGMDVEQARLILDADGEAYLCGTSRSDGRRRRRHPDGFGRRQIKKRREPGRAGAKRRPAQTGGKYEYRIVIVGAVRRASSPRLK